MPYLKMGETVAIDTLEGSELLHNGQDKVLFTRNTNVVNDEDNKELAINNEEDGLVGKGDSDKTQNRTEEAEYKVYPQRWWILWTSVGIQIFNFAHFAAFPSVNKNLAKYYHQDGDKMDWIVNCTVLLRGPLCILLMLFGERLGLKRWLHISSGLAIGGGVLCLLSSLPGLDRLLGYECQYWFALIGQCMYGVTYTIIQNLTTEISESWFDAGGRVLATTFLTIAFSFGLILGQGLTPQFVSSPEDVYLLNIVWSVPTILFSVACLLTVTRDHPPTPPCRSRAKKLNIKHKTFKDSFRAFLDPSILLFILCLAVNNGFIIVLTSKTEQILCACGYSDQFGGLLIMIMVVSGWFAAFLLGYLAGIVGHMLAIGKVMLFFFTICIACNSYLIRIPEQYYGIGVIFGFLGAFIFGGAPICMEVLAEVTYPAHQSISLSLFGLAACINSSVWLVLEGFMKGRPLTPEEMSIQTCNEQHGGHNATTEGISSTVSSIVTNLLENTTLSLAELYETGNNEENTQKPKDYTVYLAALTAYIAFFNFLMIIFFNSPFKRAMANKEEPKIT